MNLTRSPNVQNYHYIQYITISNITTGKPPNIRDATNLQDTAQPIPPIDFPIQMVLHEPLR